MVLHKTFRYQLTPTTQVAGLYRFAGARRYVFNWALRHKIDYYREFGETLTTARLEAELVEMKRDPETAWLAEIDSQLLQQALRDLERAFTSFFEQRARFPRFKRRKDARPSFRIPQRVHVEEGQLVVPKLGTIRMRYHRPLEGTPKSATIKRDACGDWYVSLVCTIERDVPDPPPIAPETTVGVDVGLKDFAVTSDGERIPAPRFARTGARRIKRAQRSLSRKQRVSANRAKAKQKLARTHRKVANQREDFLHQTARRLVNRFDTICLEDLCVRGLGRTNLSASVYDAGLGMFRRLIEQKAAWNGKRVVIIDRFFPSSKRCWPCGTVNAALTLGEREWTCPSCHAVLDRDLNAAWNIRDHGLWQFAAGGAETTNACGADVRPATAGTRR